MWKRADSATAVYHGRNEIIFLIDLFYLFFFDIKYHLDFLYCDLRGKRLKKKKNVYATLKRIRKKEKKTRSLSGNFSECISNWLNLVTLLESRTRIVNTHDMCTSIEIYSNVLFIIITI